ncbi:two-component sensor histidine kinase [Actinomadura craniellae]|uniref:histidine kinase n=1 Tax=Actinomadura craniellae TaxID=2231787 RepID=A0A365H0B1_9ACTN|nr:ATP-binding protein [Actinomadura craniellae]RAY12522.1 two-component sensor histidine kinase [Actinomadura craniellae]
MRRVVFLVSLAVTSMVALAFLVPLALTVREIARDRALTDAERQANAIGPVLVVTAERSALERAVASTQAGAARRMAVHLPDGGRVGPGWAGRAELTEAARRGKSYAAPVGGGYAFLQPVTLDQDKTAVVEVYLPAGDLSQGVGTAWLVMTLVGSALVAGSVLVADRLGARMVRATRRLADAAGALGDGDLSVRVDPQGPPELVEAGIAFNAMADHVTQLLAAEREMAADLSHRLRTPLAALRLNVEALTPGPVADQTRAAVDQLEREVDLIIRTARRPRGRGSCDAAKVLRERVGFWSALAEDEGRACELISADRPAPVPLPAGELEAAVDALLGNVFRHTGEGTAFAVTLHVGEGVTGILVADAGRGIADPVAALERGRSSQGSTGLGLDIARRAAESTGGHLRIERSALGGAQVQMWLRTGARAPSRRGLRRRPR